MRSEALTRSAGKAGRRALGSRDRPEYRIRADGNVRPPRPSTKVDCQKVPDPPAAAALAGGEVGVDLPSAAVDRMRRRAVQACASLSATRRATPSPYPERRDRAILERDDAQAGRTDRRTSPRRTRGTPRWHQNGDRGEERAPRWTGDGFNTRRPSRSEGSSGEQDSRSRRTLDRGVARRGRHRHAPREASEVTGSWGLSSPAGTAGAHPLRRPRTACSR